jgi:hypothetical protein
MKRLHSDPRHAPPSYRDTEPPNPHYTMSPELYEQVKAMRSAHAPEPLRGRLYICAKCRHPGGTLKNVGTRAEPLYLHPACQRALDKKLAGGNI